MLPKTSNPAPSLSASASLVPDDRDPSSDLNAPISDAEADAALACLTEFERIVLAVSGGPDSLALLVLAREWLQRRKAQIAIAVATVDHGLRQESAHEAVFVADAAAASGLPHATLPWLKTRVNGNMAQAARNARYGLLEAYAADWAAASPTGVARTAVVTAHTLDDQAETFLMRLMRGSGVEGLAGMRVMRPIARGSNVMLLRPLLEFPKSRLIATLQVRDVAWCDDPTNSDLRYERSRVRSALRDMNAAGLTSTCIGRSTRRLDEARAALDYATGQFEKSLDLKINNHIYESFERKAFICGPRLLRARVLSGLIANHGGTTPTPELLEIEGLVRDLEQSETIKLTLGGAVISQGPRYIRIWREAGRINSADVELEPGQNLLWDNRFWVGAGPSCRSSVIVKALGEAGYLSIAEHVKVKSEMPAKAAHALPAFWSAGTLLAVPQLAVYGLLAADSGHVSSVPRVEWSAAR